PITHASGELDGEYRYMFKYCRGLTTECFNNDGYITQPIRVDDGRVLLTDFLWVGADSITATPDSIAVYIYRTKANPGSLDPRDSAFYLGYLAVAEDAAELDTFVIIDSIADGSLGAGLPLFTEERIGIDSVGAYDHRYGAPSYIGMGAIFTYTAETDTTRDAGIYHGIVPQAETLGVMYAATFIDTVTGIESDTGRSLAIRVNVDSVSTGGKPLNYRLTLPNYPSDDSGIVRNLYRAHIFQITHDTTFLKYDTIWTGRFDHIPVIYTTWKHLLAV
ncbi:unnamed protein product, partial [marine sediment metagenome]